MFLAGLRLIFPWKERQQQLLITDLLLKYPGGLITAFQETSDKFPHLLIRSVEWLNIMSLSYSDNSLLMVCDREKTSNSGRLSHMYATTILFFGMLARSLLLAEILKSFSSFSLVHHRSAFVLADNMLWAVNVKYS